MATYGEPGKSEFKLSNINGKYSLVVNPTTKVTQIYQRKSQFDFQSIGTLNLNTNKLTFDTNAPLTKDNKSALSKNINIFKQQSVATATIGGAANAQELLLGNTQPTPPTPAGGNQPSQTGGSADAGPGTGSGATSENIPNSENLYSEDDNYGNLFYPENLKTIGQDYVFITQYRYKNPDFLSVGESASGDVSQILKGGLSTFQDTTQRTQLGTVILPMTNNLTETNQTGWGEDSLSNIAAALMTGGTDAIKKAAGGDLFGAGGSLTDLGKEVLSNPGISARAKTYLTTRAAASVIQKIGFQINPEAYITRATGTIPNPNLELLFNGPKLRSFELAFKMSPRSPKEAKMIRKIIKFFKKGMAPRRSSSGEQSFFLGTPNVFKVQFNSGANELQSLVEYKTCALVTCQVNYTPDGFYAAYNDPNTGSQPIAVTIQLGFAELTPVYNDQYDLNSDSVGPDRTKFEKFSFNDVPQTDTKTTAKQQNPNLPGAGTKAGSPVPPIVTGVDTVTGSKNKPPLAGSPGSLAGGI